MKFIDLFAGIGGFHLGMKQHRERHTCRICGKPAKGYHLCNKHYIRWKKYGDPLYHKIKVSGV